MIGLALALASVTRTTAIVVVLAVFVFVQVELELDKLGSTSVGAELPELRRGSVRLSLMESRVHRPSIAQVRVSPNW